LNGELLSKQWGKSAAGGTNKRSSRQSTYTQLTGKKNLPPKGEGGLAVHRYWNLVKKKRNESISTQEPRKGKAIKGKGIIITKDPERNKRVQRVREVSQ